MYNYTLAIELAKSHDVTLLSNYKTWCEMDDTRHDILHGLQHAGVHTIDISKAFTSFKQYDIAIISQQTMYPYVKQMKPYRIINVIHSEYDVEQPILDDNVEYVAIRPSIKDRLVKSFGIPESKVRVIYNGVDRERFAPIGERIDLGRTRIIIPCTLDPLREKFLLYWIDVAKRSRSTMVELYGKDCGAKLGVLPENVSVNPPTFHIEDVMRHASYVAGILLGRVNLEARSMGIESLIHDPIKPEKYNIFYPSEEEFDKKHNIVNVAKEIISC
jgi:glycosyltransferase involved in cell wall biosynthesis